MQLIYLIINYLLKAVKHLHHSGIARLHGINISYKPGHWAIGADDLIVLEKEILRFLQKKHVNILEFGCGTSTIAIISILEKKFKSYELTSIEASDEWIKKIDNIIKSNFPNATNHVQILKCAYSNTTKNFDLDTLRPLIQNSYNLILVDAPPDINGENIRLQLCERVLPLLNDKGILILHDTNRIEEMYAYISISKKFSYSNIYETEKGISVMRYPIRKLS